MRRAANGLSVMLSPLALGAIPTEVVNAAGAAPRFSTRIRVPGLLVCSQRYWLLHPTRHRRDLIPHGVERAGDDSGDLGLVLDDEDLEPPSFGCRGHRSPFSVVRTRNEGRHGRWQGSTT